MTTKSPADVERPPLTANAHVAEQSVVDAVLGGFPQGSCVGAACLKISCFFSLGPVYRLCSGGYGLPESRVHRVGKLANWTNYPELLESSDCLRSRRVGASLRGAASASASAAGSQMGSHLATFR